MQLFKLELSRLWGIRKTYFFVLIGLLLVLLLFFYNQKKEQEESQASQNNLNLALVTARKEWTWFQPGDEHYQSVQAKLAEVENYAETFEKGADLDFLQQESTSLEVESELRLFNSPLRLNRSNKSKLILSNAFFTNKLSLNQELLNQKSPAVSMRYGTKNFAFLSTLFYYLLGLVGIIFLLLTFGDTLSNSIAENKIKFLLVEPLSRSRIFLTNYLLSLGNAYLYTLLLAGFAFIFSSLFGGRLKGNYPVLISKGFFETKVYPISLYLIQALVLFLFVFAFCLALNFLISLFIKNSIASMTITLTLLSYGNFLFTKLPLFKNVAHFSPFTYLNVSAVFMGRDFEPLKSLFSYHGPYRDTAFLFLKPIYYLEYYQVNAENQSYYSGMSLATLFNNSEIGLSNGILSLSFGTGLLLLISLYWFKRRSSFS